MGWISANQPLKKDFIDEFQNFVYWEAVPLSEVYVEEHQVKVNWRWVSMKQSFSDDFIIEYQDRVA